MKILSVWGLEPADLLVKGQQGIPARNQLPE